MQHRTVGGHLDDIVDVNWSPDLADIYIYIYRQREIQRERERDIHIVR